MTTTKQKHHKMSQIINSNLTRSKQLNSWFQVNRIPDGGDIPILLWTFLLDSHGMKFPQNYRISYAPFLVFFKGNWAKSEMGLPLSWNLKPRHRCFFQTQNDTFSIHFTHPPNRCYVEWRVANCTESEF